MNFFMLTSALAGEVVDDEFVPFEELDERTWVCARCGERHLIDGDYEPYEFDGEDWCEECYEEDTFECDRCGERHLCDEERSVRVSYNCWERWCDDCYQWSGYYCEDCDEYMSEDYAYRTADDRMVCGACIEDNYTQCDECMEYVPNDEIRETGEGNYVCYSCLENSGGYAYCEECDTWVRSSNYDFDLDMCEDCASERTTDDEDAVNNSVSGDMVEPASASADEIIDSDTEARSPNAVVRPYHSRPALNWIGRALPSWNGRMRGVGVELEVDGNGQSPTARQRQRALNKIDRIAGDRVYFNADCSLTHGGFEIITKPLTFEAFHEMPWADIMRACSENGFSSHDAGTCGLHFHFSRELFGEDTATQDDNISKLVQFFEFYWDDMVKVSRREGNQLRWCNKKGYISKKRIKDYVQRKWGGHDEAVNNGNTNTVEIRIMRGTLNYKSFMACFDVCKTLVEKCTTVDWGDISEPDEMLKGITRDTAEYLIRRGAFYETARRAQSGTL